MRGLRRATLLYLAFTIVVTYPLSIHPATLVLSDSSDTDLFVWTLAWDAHALAHRPWAIFEANIFYPFHHTLAFSENLIGSALLAAPVIWLTGNAVLAMNLVALASCVLCGTGTYLLARRLGIGDAGALIAGLVFAFAPPRLLRIDQLFLATIMWIPFSLAFLQAYFDDGRARDLRLAAAFFTLQALTSGHGAVFLLLAALLLAGHGLAVGVRPGLLGRVPRDFGVPGLLLAAVVLLLALPYRSVQAELGLRRSLDDWRVLHAASFLAAPTYAQEFLTSHLLPDAHINQTADAYLFPGWTALLLAGVGLVGHRVRSARSALSVAATWTALAADVAMVAAATVAVLVPAHGTLRLKAGGVALLTARAGWRVWAVVALCLVLRIAVGRLPGAGAAERRVFAALTAWCARQWRARTLPFAALVGLSIWLAIGPPFSLWPYVYWLPGFNFVRVSSRFTLLGILGLAVLAGAGAEAATDGLRRRTRAAVVAALAAAVCVECLVPIDAVPYAVRIPDADRWLATQAGTFAIAEVPVPDIRQPGLLNKFQSTYMLHSTAHWQKTVHGWSGLMPDSQLELFDALSHFPDEASIQALQRVQVMYVVVHRSLYSDDDWTAVARQLRTTPQLAVVYSDDSSEVYRVWR